MSYLSNFEKFNEDNLYKDFKKESPLKKGTVNSNIKPVIPKAVEGGVVLIISNPFKDGLKRIYMRLIDKVRKDNNSDTIRVDLFQYYILKEYSDGTIVPEMIEPLTPQQRYLILNMQNNGLYLNDDKTPLWEISCALGKVNFFARYQSLLRTIKDNYKDVIIPPTQSKQKPNLHL